MRCSAAMVRRGRTPLAQGSAVAPRSRAPLAQVQRWHRGATCLKGFGSVMGPRHCARDSRRDVPGSRDQLQGAHHLPHQLAMASWGPCSVKTTLGNPRPAGQSGVLQPFEPKDCGCSPTWPWGRGKWSRNGARSLVMCCWSVPRAVSVMCDNGHRTAGGSPGDDGHTGLQPHVAKFVGFPPICGQTPRRRHCHRPCGENRGESFVCRGLCGVDA